MQGLPIENILQSWQNLINFNVINSMNIEPKKLLKINENSWVFWKDVAGRMQGCNDNLAEALQLPSPKSIIGKTDYDLPYLQSESKYYQTCDQMVMSSRITRQFHENLTLTLTSRPKKFQLLTIKNPLINEVGNVVGIIGISFPGQSIAPADFLNNLTLSRCNQKKINGIQLSKREIEILQILIQGKTAREIASILYLSRRTIENYLAKLKDKLNVSTKSQLIDMVYHSALFKRS